MSQAFQTAHSSIAAAVDNCCRIGPCNFVGRVTCRGNWQFLGSPHEFAHQKTRDRSAATVALVVSKEKRCPDLAGFNHVFSGPEFLQFVTVLDLANCHFGS